MKKLCVALTAALLIAAVSISLVSSASADKTVPALPKLPAQTAENLSAETNNALGARLGQLINLNRAFDECLDSPTALVDEASVILLDQAEEIDGRPVIAMGKVLSFIYDLYGIQLDVSALSDFYTTTAAGYFDIVPRGYDNMKSTITGTELLADGRIKASAELVISGHDGENITFLTETIFVQNPVSAFGYNIAAARIIGEADGEYNKLNPMDIPLSGFEAMSLN